MSVPSQPMCILLSSYSSSTSSFPIPTSFCIYASFLLSLPASSLASVIPHGLIIISKRDSGLLLRAVLPWNNMCILNQAPQQGPGWFICNRKRHIMQTVQVGACEHVMVPALQYDQQWMKSTHSLKHHLQDQYFSYDRMLCKKKKKDGYCIILGKII